MEHQDRHENQSYYAAANSPRTACSMESADT